MVLYDFMLNRGAAGCVAVNSYPLPAVAGLFSWVPPDETLAPLAIAGHALGASGCPAHSGVTLGAYQRPVPPAKSQRAAERHSPSANTPLQGSSSASWPHNVGCSFRQLPARDARGATYAYLFRSMRTLRFLLIARAGRLTRIGGRRALWLTENPAAEAL
jgi:hypothetical protein